MGLLAWAAQAWAGDARDCDVIDGRLQSALDAALGATTAADWLAGAQGRARLDVQVFDAGTDVRIAVSRRPAYAPPAPPAAPGLLLAPFVAAKALATGAVTLGDAVFMRPRLSAPLYRYARPVTALDFKPLREWLRQPETWGVVDLLARLPPRSQGPLSLAWGLCPSPAADAARARSADMELWHGAVGAAEAPLLAPDGVGRLHAALARGGWLPHEWRTHHGVAFMCERGLMPFDAQDAPRAVLPWLRRDGTPAAQAWISLAADVAAPEWGQGPRAWRIAMWPSEHPRYVLVLSVERAAAGDGLQADEADLLLRRLMAVMPVPAHRPAHAAASQR